MKYLKDKKRCTYNYLLPNRDEYYAAPSIFPGYCMEKIHLASIFPFQYFSIRASLVPFIKHNDVDLALISSNMQRQAIQLFQFERCIVEPELECQAAQDTGV